MDIGADSYRRFREDGDADGMSDLIREYRDGLILYLDTFVHNIHTAEELAEDVFVRLVVKKPKFNGKSTFKTWLYSIGNRKALAHMRRARRRKNVTLKDLDGEPAEEESLESAYIREERRIEIHRAMKTLPPDQRQILWLVYFENLSAAEAAKLTGRSAHAAESLAYRARKALKEKLIKKGYGYEDL